MRAESFGKMIRRLRLENRLTLREVAHCINLDQSTLSKIERNDTVAPPRIIKSLARCLHDDYRKLQVTYLRDKLCDELMGVDYSLEALELVKQKLKTESSGVRFSKASQKLIRKIQQYFEGKPVKKAWVFGSFARGQDNQESDLDILVTFLRPNALDLFDYAEIKRDLEELTGRKVDLAQEGFLLPHVEENAEKDKILIYERETG